MAHRIAFCAIVPGADEDHLGGELLEDRAEHPLECVDIVAQSDVLLGLLIPSYVDLRAVRAYVLWVASSWEEVAFIELVNRHEQ